MSTAFNLTAQLNLRGPTNVRNIVSSIRRQLGTISADVNLRIDPAATRNLTQLNTALTNFNRTLRTTQTNATTTANALRGLANAIGSINANNLPRNMANIATASNRAAQATGRVTTQVEQARNQMEEFGRQSALAVRRFAAFSISAGIIVGFTNAVNKGVKAFIDFDKELVKLQQVTGESAKGLSGLQKTIGDLASGLGVSSSELINVSSTLAQAGLSARDTEKALKALALSSLAPSFDDMNKTVEGSIALMRQFGIGAGQLDQALGSVNAVAAKFAVEASDIIAAIQRTGGVFAAASKGVSEGTQALNEFIAVFTSIRATTRESAETIATGLRTIFTRVQRGETIEALKQYGVNLTDLEGKFVGAYKAVELLSRGLNQIDPRDLRFSQIVEELGGFRQIGKVIPLIQQFATAQQALAVAQRGQGSLAEDAAIAQLSLANQIAKVREEFLTLIRDIGGTDTFQTIAKSALGLASALIKVADSVKGVLPVLGVVMAIRGTAALSSYTRGFAGGMSRGGGGRRAAQGGYIKYAEGGQVPVALMPGEAVIYPEAAKRIGTPTLRKMNYADRRQKRARGGSVGMVPGTGNSDSFYTTLPEGSFVIRKAATRAMGADSISKIASGKQRFADGGSVQKFKDGSWRTVEAQVRAGRGRPSKNTTTVGDAVDKISNKSYDNRKGRFKSDFPFIIRGLNRSGTKSQINEEKILDKYLKRGVDDLSKAIVAQTQNNITIPSGDVGIQNKESIYGGLFETALLKISNKSRDKKENNQNFDFPRGIGSTLSNMFSGMPPDISTDVKRTAAANAAMKTNVANKIANEMVAGKPQRVSPVGVVALSPTDSAIVSKISGVEVDKLLNSKLKQKSKDRMKRAFGGLIQKLAKGGRATRNVGYIDSDEITQLLKDPTKGPLIKAEMDRLGIKGVADYKEHLSNLAASKRQDGSLKRLTSIFGVAGSGKSTMVQGGSQASQADNAKLRKTNRYPILTESDLLRSDQVIDSTSVAGPSQKPALSAADRVIALSSRTKESQEILKRQRKSRDTSGKNLFGRKPGSTKSAPLDSGIGEAYIAASGVSGVDPKKVRTLKIGENFKKTRTGQPSVRTPETTGLFYGNFGPTTKGHVSVVKEAEKLGIPAKDFVALVGGDTPIDPSNKDPHSRRTAIFPQKSSDQLPSRLGMARAAFGAMGANVSAMPKNSSPGSIPPAFKVGEDSYIVPKGKKDVAFVGDEKEAGSLTKYEKLGYSVKSLPRSEGISGTKARDAIMANDTAALKNLLSPEGFDYVQKHMDTLQKRPQLLDSILSKIESNSASGRGTAGRLAKVKSALSDLPARVSKTTPADVVSKIESLRKERDSLSSKLGRLPARLVSRMEQRQRFSDGASDPIKKKKVKKINPNDYSQSIQNLQADPSSILRQKAVGVAILQGPKKGTVDSSVSKKSILQSVGKQYSDLLGSAIGGGSIGIQREALKPQVYKDFNEGIENGLVQAVNTAVATISNKYPELPKPAINGEEERRKYLKGVNDGAKGNMFEEILTSMKNKGVYDANPDPQRSFDFSPNKGSAFGLSNVFDKISSLLYVDAKAASPSDAAMSKKIANQTLRDLGVIKGRKSKDEPDLASVESAISKRFQSLAPNTPVSLQDLQKEIPAAKMKMVNSVAKRMGLVIDRAGGKTNFMRKGMASGGEVPILAQEGEYVINRKSAKAIGYGNLHALNKYHTGGVVQKLAKGSSGPLTTRTVAGLESDAAELRVSLKQLLNAFKANRDKFYEQERASGKSKSQASRAADERTANAYKTLVRNRTGRDPTSDISRSSVKQLQQSGYLRGYGTSVPKGINANRLQAVEKEIGRVFGGLEDTLDKLVNAGERQSKKLRAQVNARAREAADNARQSALSAGRTNDEADQDARNAYDQTRRSGMRDVARKVKSRQATRDVRLEQLGVQTTDATGKRLSRKQIKENASRVLDLSKQAVEGRKESLVRSRFKALKQDNPGMLSGAVSNSGLGRTINRGYRAITGRDLPTKRTDASLMAQARKEVEKILQLETKRAAETAKQLSNERAKTNASAKAKQTAVTQAATSGGGGGNTGGGGGGSGRRRSSGGGSQQQDRGNNGRIMGMGRLTQAGFGISMMGGLGSQFFNPESSASNASNAAFTESFTSTIGMGATVAGSIGDLFGGGGGDDDSNRRRPARNSRSRGPSTPNRPPSGGGGGSGRGSSRSSGGGSRGGGPRVTAASGGGSGIGGILGGIGGAFAAVAVAGLAVAEGLKAAHNAAREFAINVANNKLGESLEKANQSIEKFSNNLSDKTLAAKAKENTLAAIKSADALDTASTKAQAGLFNLNDAMEGGAGSYERSQILNSNQGIAGYLSTISLGGMLRSEEEAKSNQASRFQELIPQLSSERAKRYTGASEASASFLDAKIRSGSSIDQMKNENPAEFVRLTKSLALADAAIQEQIMSIQNSTSMTEEQKKKTIDSIIAQDGEKKAREINTKALRDKALENLNKTTNMLQNSLERMFQNMEQAIASNAYALDKLTASADLASASLSGSAKVGSVKLDSINALQNPRANTGQPMKSAVNQAASMFGNEAPAIKAMLQVASSMEDAVMSSINTTLKNNPGATNELVGGSIDKSIFKVLTDLKLPPDLSSKISSEVGLAIKDMRKSGEDKVDFSQIVEKIPQLGKVLDSAKRAQEVAIRALENWQGALNEYANTTNQLIDIQIDSNQKLRRATDILINGQNELAKAVGKSVSLQSVVNDSRARTAAQTGGATDPGDIRRNIQDLELRRQSEQARSDTAAQKGFGGKDEFMMMQDRLRNTSVALRENYDALKNMAENTDVASAALNKISEIRQQRQAGVGFAEKLVSSTPRELANLNMSMARLQNNMSGRMNVSNPGQRSADLQLFNELAPLLGDRQSEMKANVLENMLKESGVGVSPMMQEVLDSLRNPEADPAMQEAIATYREAIGLQAEANKQLVFLNTQMAENNADIAAQKLVQSLQGVTLSFDSARLSDINQGIQLLLAEVKKNNGAGMGGAPAVGKARGGIIYASEGTMVNFQPKGTDTVPAMLTPGEFVVNKKATQKNLGLLKQINGNGYSSGGSVRYYSDGGYVFGKEWTPMSNFVETEEGAQKRALGRYDSSKETETKNYLPALNWKELDNIKLDEVWTVKDAPSYIVNNAPDILTKQWVYPGAKASDIDINTSGLEWRLGAGYSSFSLPLGGGAGVSSLGDVKTTTPGVWESIKIPSLEWLTKMNDPAGDRTKVKQRDAASYIKQLTNFLGNIGKDGGVPDLVDQTSSLGITAAGKTISLSKNAGGITPDTEPKINFAVGGNRLTVSGLSTKPKSNSYSLLLNDQQKKDVTEGNDKGNFIAARQDFSSVGNALLQGISYALIQGSNLTADTLGADYKPEDYETGILGTAITAGRSASANPTALSSWSFGETLSKYIQPNSLSKTIMDKMASNITSLSSIFGIKEKVSMALGQLQDPNSFAESEASESNRNYVNKLQQLLSGSVFKATFSEAEIQGKDSAKPPITLYNLDGNDWDSRVDVLNADPSVTKGTYAGKKGGSWIPVGSRTMGVGSVPDRFDIQKWFPWISSGFNSTIFDDLKNKYNTQNPNNVKITPGSYSDELMAFNYKNVEGPMFDANKKMTKNKYKFTTVSLDPGIVNEPLNPFKDLADQKLLSQDPEKSEIYANTPADLIGMIRNLVNNTILRTQQNTLSFGSSIKSLSSADKAISDLDFAQQTKENAYLLNSIAPGFQYEAKLYGDELRKKIAKEQQNQQATAGEKGIANKANLQDLPEDPLLLADQARGIVRKVLSPVSGILSAYNVRLFPIRTASQISPYGNYLLQAQKFFAGAVTQKFKNNKKGIDQRLWNVWGALGASGQVFEKLGAGDKQGLQTLLGSAAGTMNSTDLGDMVARYGALLAARGSTFAGTAGLASPEQALKKEVGDNDKQTIEGIFKKAQTEEATVARDGRLTVNKSDGRNLPTNLLDLGKKIVNPYSTFQATDRSSLFDILIKGLAKYDNKGVKRNVNEKLVTSLQSLRQFYATYLDPIVSGGVTPNADMIQKISDQYPTMNAILQVLTNGEYGMMPDAKKMQELAAAKKARMEAEKKASGGIVYASTGTLVNYQPRGTDTVPAMLTPGEFVINKQATQRHLPLIKAINSNRYQTGGIVQPQYHDIGNMVSGASKAVGSIAGAIGIKLDTGKLETEINKVLSDGAKLLSGALQLSGQDRNALSTFGDNFRSLLSQMSQINIPPEIRFSMQPVQVNITGAQGLTDAAQSLVNGAIKKAFASFLSVNDLNGTYKPPE